MKIRAGGGDLGQEGGDLGQQGAPPCYSSLWETLQGCFFLKASIINLALSKVQIFLTPHDGSHFDLVAFIEECFNNYTGATRKILGFDK